VLASLAALAVAAGPTVAATPFDLQGSWDCCGSGGAAPQTWNIATTDLNSGQVIGSGVGGSLTFDIRATANGDQITYSASYNELPSYTATWTGTIAANGRSMSGTWSDTNGQSGTWIATRRTAPPPPVAGKTLNAKVVSGKVLVKLPRSKVFDDLNKVAVQLPVGTVVDTTKGRIQLTAAQSLTTKKTATATFFKGIFRIGQKAAARPITDLKLVGGSFAPCGKSSRTSAKAAQKTKVRTLWGAGKGLFRTSGKFSAATIRGTAWAVTDYCDGTLTKVTQGSVTVRDFRLKKNVVVKAPRSYFAKAP
jgi:hypothetical protein